MQDALYPQRWLLLLTVMIGSLASRMLSTIFSIGQSLDGTDTNFARLRAFDEAFLMLAAFSSLAVLGARRGREAVR